MADVLWYIFFSLWIVSFVAWVVTIIVKRFREKRYYLTTLIIMNVFCICQLICRFFAE